jgi:hypothetical protein
MWYRPEFAEAGFLQSEAETPSLMGKEHIFKRQTLLWIRAGNHSTKGF